MSEIRVDTITDSSGEPNYLPLSGDTMTGDLVVPNLNVSGVITNKQVAKAYGSTYNPSGNYNVASQVWNGSNLTVTFTTPMSNSNYHVVASLSTAQTTSGDTAVWITNSSRTSTDFILSVRQLGVDTRTSTSNETVVIRGTSIQPSISFVVFAIN